jgi:toxin ParE1/3/4
MGRNLPRVADTFADQVFRATAMLETFPQMGRSVPEAERPEIRELLVRNYRLIYRFEDDLVEILTIIRGARRIDPRTLMN